jgi:diguanylate cyclase (GGDEF)-like protein
MIPATHMVHSLGMLAQADVPVWCGLTALAGVVVWGQQAIQTLARRQERQVQTVLETLVADGRPTATEAEHRQPIWAPAIASLADQMRLQRMLVRRDPLTGLANRRGFDEAMHTAWLRAVSQAEPCALLMLDLDHFKQLNDSIGHRQADEALCQVAAALREHIRPIDTVARWGGEEFAVLLPNTHHVQAAAIAERLRRQIGRLPAGLTVSIGIAGFPDHAGSPEALLDAADAALYRAKGQGRDRCEVASGLESGL